MTNREHPNTDPLTGRPNNGARQGLWRTDGAARYDLLALAILLVGVTLFHWRGIRPGQTFLPVDLANNLRPWLTQSQPVQNILISDPLYQFYPFLAHAVRTVQNSGAWPLWNPHIFLGHPIVGDPLMQAFYPFFVVLGLILGAPRGLAIGLWLHVLLAGALTYGLLRALRCDWRAALLGAFTYALGGYLVTWFETLFWVATLAWLPGVLWMFELSLRRRSVPWAALAGLALGLAILGGQFQFLVTFGVFFALWAFGRTWEAARAREARPAWPLLALVIAGIVGGLIGAAQAVPFAEFLSMSRRVVEHGLTDRLPWRQLVSLVIPNFYGNPTAAAAWQYWGEGNYAESTIYGGLVALLLACAAPLSARRFRTWCLFGLAAALVYFVVGGPGIRALGEAPVLKYASLHRSAFLLPLILALLASLGLSEPELRPRAVLVVASALIAWVALGWWMNWSGVQAHGQALARFVRDAAIILGVAVALLLARARWPDLRPLADLCLVALTFGDLFLWGARFNPAGPIASLMPPTPVIDFLASRPGNAVVQPYQRSDVLFGPNVLSLYGVGEAGGYSSLAIDDYYRLIAAGDPKVDIGWMDRSRSNIVAFSHPTDRLLDLLRVNYLVAQEPWGEPRILAEQVIDGCTGDGGEIDVGRTASGSFPVHAAAINRVDVRLRPAPVVRPGGALLLRLWRGAARTTLVAEVRQDLKQESDDGSLTFYFAPEREAPGQIYAWEISAANEEATGVAVCRDALGRPAISVYGAEGHQAFAGELYVFERFSVLPRAYVAYAAEQAGDDAEATARLLDPDFDVRNVVLTSASSGLPKVSGQPATRAVVQVSEDGRVVAEAHVEQPGLLVLADQYHPGWQARMDGKPVPVQRVNQFMRGVLVPAGKHQVEFVFAPPSVKLGVALSLGGVALGVVLVVAGGRCRCHRSANARRRLS